MKSQKLLSLQTGPYTVIEKITEVTYRIQKYFTNEKKIVHRNHIDENFPKEQQMPKLLQEYSSDFFSSDFHDHKPNQQINSFNKPQQVQNLQYQFWPVVNNGYQQMTDHYTTNEDQIKTIVIEQSLDLGKETMHLRTLFNATAIDQNFRPIQSSTPYPVDKSLILLLVNLVVMATAAYLAAVSQTSLSNDFAPVNPI